MAKRTGKWDRITAWRARKNEQDAPQALKTQMLSKIMRVLRFEVGSRFRFTSVSETEWRKLSTEDQQWVLKWAETFKVSFRIRLGE